MGRQKRDSKVLPLIRSRIVGLGSIAPALDLGAGVSVESLTKQRDDLEAALASYNDTLSQLDEKLNDIIAMEKRVSDLCERALTGVAARYGKDSNEYEKAGGVRKSERKKPGTRAAAAAARAKKKSSALP